MIRGEFSSVEAEAVRVEVCVDAIDGSVAVTAREWVREKLHHTWIGIHSGKGLAVGFAPAPENEPRSGENDHLCAVRKWVS